MKSFRWRDYEIGILGVRCVCSNTWFHLIFIYFHFCAAFRLLMSCMLALTHREIMQCSTVSLVLSWSFVCGNCIQFYMEFPLSDNFDIFSSIAFTLFPQSAQFSMFLVSCENCSPVTSLSSPIRKFFFPVFRSSFMFNARLLESDCECQSKYVFICMFHVYRRLSAWAVRMLLAHHIDPSKYSWSLNWTMNTTIDRQNIPHRKKNFVE